MVKIRKTLQQDQKLIFFFELLQRYFKTKSTFDRLKDCDNNLLLKEHANFMKEFLDTVEEEVIHRIDQAIDYLKVNQIR